MAEWKPKIKKWQTSKNGLFRGIKVVRNVSGYIVACISYKVKISSGGEKILHISGLLIPNMFKSGILKKLSRVFENLMENENCGHVIIGSSGLSTEEKELFGNQLENLLGTAEHNHLSEKFSHKTETK